MTNSTKPKRDSQGCVYVNTNKETGQKSLNIILEDLPEPDAEGKITLIGLVNTYKTKATQPDFNVLTANKHGQERNTNGAQGRAAAGVSKPKQAFPVDL
jgi:hypothetical protein